MPGIEALESFRSDPTVMKAEDFSRSRMRSEAHRKQTSIVCLDLFLGLSAGGQSGEFLLANLLQPNLS